MPSPNASVGLAVFPEDGEDFETLMRAADQRLLRRKSNGHHFSAAGPGHAAVDLSPLTAN